MAPALLICTILLWGLRLSSPLRVPRGLREVALRALADPYVRRARAIRCLPQSLHLRVERRRAVALWEGGKLLDERGDLFRAPTMPTKLPRIRGFVDTQEALRLLRFLQGTGFRPLELWRDPCWGFCIRTVGGMVVRWGSSLEAQDLRCLRAVMEDLQHRGLRARRLDLSLAGRAFVEVADGPTGRRP